VKSEKEMLSIAHCLRVETTVASDAIVGSRRRSKSGRRSFRLTAEVAAGGGASLAVVRCCESRDKEPRTRRIVHEISVFSHQELVLCECRIGNEIDRLNFEFRASIGAAC
jgi:hypothetical protein